MCVYLCVCVCVCMNACSHYVCFPCCVSTCLPGDLHWCPLNSPCQLEQDAVETHPLSTPAEAWWDALRSTSQSPLGPVLMKTSWMQWCTSDLGPFLFFSFVGPLCCPPPTQAHAWYGSILFLSCTWSHAWCAYMHICLPPCLFCIWAWPNVCSRSSVRLVFVTARLAFLLSFLKLLKCYL